MIAKMQSIHPLKLCRPALEKRRLLSATKAKSGRSLIPASTTRRCSPFPAISPTRQICRSPQFPRSLARSLKGSYTQSGLCTANGYCISTKHTISHKLYEIISANRAVQSASAARKLHCEWQLYRL